MKSYPGVIGNLFLHVYLKILEVMQQYYFSLYIVLHTSAFLYFFSPNFLYRKLKILNANSENFSNDQNFSIKISDGLKVIHVNSKMQIIAHAPTIVRYVVHKLIF